LTGNRLAPNVRSRHVRRDSTFFRRDVRGAVLLDVDNRSAVRNERLDKLLRRGIRDAVLQRETHDFSVRRGGVEEHDRGGTSGGDLLRPVVIIIIGWKEKNTYATTWVSFFFFSSFSCVL